MMRIFEKQLEQVYLNKQNYIDYLVRHYKIPDGDAEEIFSDTIYECLEKIKINPIEDLKLYLFKAFKYHYKKKLGSIRIEEQKIKEIKPVD